MADREPTMVERLKRVENKLLADGNQYGAEVCFRAAKKLEAAEAKLQAVGELHTYIYNAGYGQGHNDTVEGCYTDILPADAHTYNADVVDEIVDYEAKAIFKDKSND